MTTLTPGQYADLRAGRRLVVAPTRCTGCGAPKKPALVTGLAVGKHNVQCAETGERSYPTGERSFALYGRAA